jgi:hypothetical protein
MLVKMKVPYEDFYRILAGPEAYVDNGFDQANVAALARLRDYDNHEDRAGYYNLLKLSRSSKKFKVCFQQLDLADESRLPPQASAGRGWLQYEELLTVWLEDDQSSG